jgi:hypothetical protein
MQNSHNNKEPVTSSMRNTIYTCMNDKEVKIINYPPMEIKKETLL